MIAVVISADHELPRSMADAALIASTIRNESRQRNQGGIQRPAFAGERITATRVALAIGSTASNMQDSTETTNAPGQCMISIDGPRWRIQAGRASPPR